MRWDDSHDSPDVIDRRGEGPSNGGGGGNLGLFYLVFWLLRRPWGWVVLFVGGVGYCGLRTLGVLGGDDPRALHGGQSAGGTAIDHDSPEVHFVSSRLGRRAKQLDRRLQFPRAGRLIATPSSSLYTDSTDTGCGQGSAATGPFYCSRRTSGSTSTSASSTSCRASSARAASSRRRSRDRARGRAPRPEVARDLGAGGDAGARRDGRLGAPRTSGRLLRGDLGPLDGRTKRARVGRHRLGAERGRGRRRRPTPANGDRNREPGVVDARLLRRAQASGGSPAATRTERSRAAIRSTRARCSPAPDAKRFVSPAPSRSIALVALVALVAASGWAVSSRAHERPLLRPRRAREHGRSRASCSSETATPS